MQERPLAQRLAAGVALLALLAAGLVSGCWILTDRADFRSLLGGPDAEAESRESSRTQPDLDRVRERSGASTGQPRHQR